MEFRIRPYSPVLAKFTVTFLAAWAARASEKPFSTSVLNVATRMAFSATIFVFSRSDPSFFTPLPTKLSLTGLLATLPMILFISLT